jgi:hypothetical protein
MLSFSQRKGLQPIRSTIQIDSADTPLRNQIWNCLSAIFWPRGAHNLRHDHPVNNLLKRLWVHYYELRLDDLDQTYRAAHRIKDDILEGDWYHLYDILQFIANDSAIDQNTKDQFLQLTNNVLAKYLSGYRFIDKVIVDITSEQEVESIETALNDSSKFKPVQDHLKRALELFADRDNPDYRNSIKESISAIESLCSIIINKPKATLGQALAELEKSYDLHPALKSAFSILYGWTSDADGIRHKMLEESTVKPEDAKFMLVACSAFINYLLVKADKP